MFTAVGQGGYVAEKAEGDKGWLFPVGRRGPRPGLRPHVPGHVRRPGRGADAARDVPRRLRRQRHHRRLLRLGRGQVLAAGQAGAMGGGRRGGSAAARAEGRARPAGRS